MIINDTDISVEDLVKISLPQPITSTTAFQQFSELLNKCNALVNSWQHDVDFKVGDLQEAQQIINQYLIFIKALNECKKVAESEYTQVVKQLEIIEKFLKDAIQINSTIQQIKFENITAVDAANKAKSDLLNFGNNFAREFEKNIGELRDTVLRQRGELKDFKIVIFGRTKVGKSTVREALTYGDGETIGRGGQSTTKSVHQYRWRNLTVFDTPGILSADVNGKSEEAEAHRALITADVVIFMVADDNISEVELTYLNQLTQASKDTLVLLNVKRAIQDFNRFEQREAKLISLEAQDGHISRIKKAVKNQAKLTFLPIHALSAFLSRGKGELVQKFLEKNGAECRGKLYDISQFSRIKDYLVNKILTSGRAIRCQTIRQSLTLTLSLLTSDNARNIDLQRKAIVSAQEKISGARKNIKYIQDDAMEYNKIENSLRNLYGLDYDIRNFAERCIDNKYSKNDISSGWNSMVTNAINNADVQSIIKRVQNQVQKEFENLKNEIKTSFDAMSAISGINCDTFDWQSVCSFGALAAGLAFCFVAGPVGWIIGGIGALLGVLSGWFKSRESKISDLEKQLNSSYNQVISTHAAQIRSSLKEELFDKANNILAQTDEKMNKMSELLEHFVSLNHNLDEICRQNEIAMQAKIREFNSLNCDNSCINSSGRSISVKTK